MFNHLCVWTLLWSDYSVLSCYNLSVQHHHVATYEFMYSAWLVMVTSVLANTDQEHKEDLQMSSISEEKKCSDFFLHLCQVHQILEHPRVR